MISVNSLAEALEQIRQGCTELEIRGARAAGNKIGAEGAKELAAALKTNATLTTLDLECACRGAALPSTPAAPPHARVQEGGARRASPARTPHARSPRHTTRAPAPACRRQ